MTCVASMMTPPQKNPAAGEPACVSYSATWKGKLEIEVPVPPTMLALARGPEAGARAVAGSVARAGEIVRSTRDGSFLPPTGRAAPAIDTAHTSTPMTGMNRD
jgi:hypothetical protein